jgi:hypothetical protein
VKKNIEQPKSWELTTSLVINIIDKNIKIKK